MALDSRALVTGAAIFSTIFIGIIMAVFVSTNAAGGIAALVPLITVILTMLALINPRAGLYGLAALVIWVDEFKRIAVFFGGAYSTTVMQTLAMPFIVLAALNAGFLLNLMFGKAKTDLLGVLIYAVGGLIGCVVFLTMAGSFPERAQRAANIAGYISLVPIAITYFKTFDDWRRFFAFQVVVALPAAAWAIKQYYFGFDQIEWEYARSGLSKVHSGQLLMFANPRTFGFFGSASALGCAAIYCAFSWWHTFRFRQKRFLWLATAFILTWVLVVSTQRTALIYPLIVLLCAYAYRTKFRVFAFYGMGFFIFFLGIINSTYLIEKGLDKINAAIASDTAWGSEVLKVGTFSDRLMGWERLKRAESYSILGTGEKGGGYDDGQVYRNHDIINKILINYGVVGLIVVFASGFVVLSALHSTIFAQQNRLDRNDNAFALALSLPMILLSFLGGDNFNTNPINLQIWTAFVGVLVARKNLIEKNALEKERSRREPSQSPPIVASS
jgi:hypothetical protein